MRISDNKSVLNPFIWRILGIGAFLAIWKVASLSIQSTLILPDPELVAISLVRLICTRAFWHAISSSFLRVFEAFLLSIAIGLVTGLSSATSPKIKAMLSPFITSIRATPVLALILIAMFWFPSSFVPIFSAVLMAFPIMHTSAEFGAHATEVRLLQMASLFHVPKKTIFWQLRFPSALPHILAGAKNVLGLSWKVIVAGEVLSQPQFALGTKMQEARLSLETAEVFAWAAMTVILCGLSEYIFGLMVQAISERSHIGSAGNPHRGIS